MAYGTDFDADLPIRIHDSLDPTLGAEVDSDRNLHVLAHGQDGSSNALSFLLSEEGHAAINGVYNATTNTDPSNFGLIGHVRNATPGDAQQTVRITSASPDSDAIDESIVFALDTNSFLKYWDSAASQWERVSGDAGAINVNISNDSIIVDVDGVYNVTTNADPDNVGLIAHTRAASPGDAEQVKRLTAVTSDTVHALDVSLHDEDGAAYSQSNPLPVSLSDSAGDDVHNYQQTSSPLAKNGTEDLDYTVTAGKTLYLKQVKIAASGQTVCDVQIETGVGTDTWNTVAMLFNSAANKTEWIDFKQAIQVAAGVKVRLTVKNVDNQSQDIYTFINGAEY